MGKAKRDFVRRGGGWVVRPKVILFDNGEFGGQTRNGNLGL